jgi:HTH-type transcriptional regulator, sugar sensing transcriptional regulator
MISQKELLEIGFSRKESNVYLALLELGPSTASQISRKAGINRTTSYDILESLAYGGLVNPIGEAKIKKYSAENPSKVLKFLENKINKFRDQHEKAKQLLPQLLSIYNIKEKPKVRFYEGNEGMKEAFEDTLNAKGEILAYAVGEDMFKALSEKYFKSYFKKRVLRGIKVRVIAPDTPESKAVSANDQKEMRESLLVPKDKFYFSIEMNIYNNKIMIASWKEKFAIIVESEEISSAQKKIFELSWEGAKILKTN